MHRNAGNKKPLRPDEFLNFFWAESTRMNSKSGCEAKAKPPKLADCKKKSLKKLGTLWPIGDPMDGGQGSQ